MLRIDRSKYFKLKKFYDFRGLTQNLNRDLDYSINAKEIMNPNTIIPNTLYNKFYKDSYVRNKILFPITIPIYYRHVYLPKDYLRTIKE